MPLRSSSPAYILECNLRASKTLRLHLLVAAVNEVKLSALRYKGPYLSRPTEYSAELLILSRRCRGTLEDIKSGGKSLEFPLGLVSYFIATISPTLNVRLVRASSFSDQLSREVRYKAGKYHTVSDSLSRLSQSCIYNLFNLITYAYNLDALSFQELDSHLIV